jgi:sterol desaturase/sphingolipid hydroxylase (fatty acid hydroxylase superfamily)
VRVDLTVLAIPGFVGAMAAELLYQRRYPERTVSRAGDYELKDTLASLSMGVGSLIAPAVTKRLLDPLTPGRGRGAKYLVGAAVVAAAATTVADVLRRRRATGELLEAGTLPERPALGGDTAQPWARAHGATAAAAVLSTSLIAATTWSAQTSGQRLFERSGRDLGTGVLATVVAIAGWDFLYYWNHRLSHESRWLWAVHVSHHSSERYNLSTALRQSVGEGWTMAVPYGALALLGVRPASIETARSLNLIYQFWIHTEAIRSIGWLERILNTPSHHRVHHGSNRQYLDRNHGGIVIIWDRLFGTFEPEREPVVYGLTRNIHTFNPLRIATHEWGDILRDIASASTWHDRFSFLLRGPGWAYDRRA